MIRNSHSLRAASDTHQLAIGVAEPVNLLADVAGFFDRPRVGIKQNPAAVSDNTRQWFSCAVLLSSPVNCSRRLRGNQRGNALSIR
jgi:hypothetical protein